MFSREPYFWTSSPAPLGPIPATPGMQSELSPWMAFMSIIWRGVTPYSSIIFCSSKTVTWGWPNLVLMRRTVVAGETSCRLSRSPVAMTQELPSRSAAAERVPRMSSASQPSQVTMR